MAYLRALRVAVREETVLPAETEALNVELWAARIPWVGPIADHHWFVIRRGSQSTDRWEVWQSSGAGGESWGHLYRNLKPPTAGVGSGPGRLLTHWSGEDARLLAERIEAAPRAYPCCGRYRLWPGPNSNTFVQWVLESRYLLGRRGIGSQYCRRLIATRPTAP